MGQYAANSIMKLIKCNESSNLEVQSPAEDQLLDCPVFQPMMVLTIGDEATMYTPEAGGSFGKGVKDVYVGRGYSIDSTYSSICCDSGETN
jgi:hypothetical protein